jgi:hypothetical protein
MAAIRRGPQVVEVRGGPGIEVGCPIAGIIRRSCQGRGRLRNRVLML